MLLESASYSGFLENPDLNYFRPEIVEIKTKNGEKRFVLDTSALLYSLYLEVAPNNSESPFISFTKNELAAMFVHAFSIGIGRLVLKHVRETGILHVCVSGGVANNDYIVTALSDFLKENGIDLLMHKNLPPGDGCISHGQIVSAAAKLLFSDKESFPQNNL